MKRIIISMMTAVALLITTVIPAYAANNGYIDDEYSDFNINDYVLSGSE